MTMTNNNRQELFLHPDPKPSSATATDPEPPRPLRINKQPNGNPAGTDEPRAQWANYIVPQPSSAAYGAPTSPPPTGPLPYPDQQRRRATPAEGRAPSRTATPQEAAEEGRAAGPPSARRRSMASDASAGSSGHGRRARFDPNDPNRPSAAYGHSPPSSAGRIAERRGTPAKSIIPPESPGGPEPPYKSPEPKAESAGYGDDGGTLFSIPVLGKTKTGRPEPAAAPEPKPEEQDFQHYYPPPLGTTIPSAPAADVPAAGTLHVPDPKGINRLASNASTSTTRASRGSPPPPETPIDPSPQTGLTGIEARYAASGIPGENTLNEMQAQHLAAAARRADDQAQSAAAAARRAQYAHTQPQAQAGAASGRWSPTERPGSEPPVRFQGTEEISSRGSDVPNQTRARQASQPTYSSAPQPSGSGASGLNGRMGSLSVHDEPPPAYSPPAPGSTHSPYPNEKGIRAATTSPSAEGRPKPSSAQDPNLSQHPAFATTNGQPISSPQPSTYHQPVQNGAASSAGMTPVNVAQANQNASPGPASPPPLPEGWIAHLDSNSGQYYYIHLPTQSTQWEFPKGPTPLHLQEPMSPIGGPAQTIASPVSSVFKQPLASPGFGPVPQSATYPGRESMFSMNSIASPTTAGFTGPPPSAGIDMYRIQPANGVYFGPYLRYTNMDLERGLWLGSIMLITDAAQPPTIHIHQSVDLSPNPRQLKAHPIHSHQRWIFYRYDIDLRMDDHAAAKWTYAITSHLGCTRYEFLVAGRYENSWRFIAHSNGDFALNVSANERSKLGGPTLMWKDVLLKHQECGGFHVQVGLGGQVYADRLWKDIPALRQWTQMSGKENRKTAPWTPKMEEDVAHAFFHYYTSHFDQPAIREAFAQIPHISCLDDRDVLDGWGSYPEYMQTSSVFKNLGRLGTDMYLLFQHHTNHEILRAVSNDIDLFTITGTGWHFLKFLGPSVVLVGPDTRSERSQSQVMAGPTYQGLFPKIAVLPPSVQHCIILLPVPVIYPRLEAVEQFAQVATTGKRVVTGGFNMLGKVAGGVAGVVGAKEVVNSGFQGVKKAVGKSGLMKDVLSPFGEVEVLDELRDLWTHESKDLERTYLIRTLQGISHNKSLRITFLSGSVSSCGAGLVHDPSHPGDHKTMYQLITSPMVNAPAPSYLLKLFSSSSSKPLYIPANGTRSRSDLISDTKEDMMEIFAADVDGRPREGSGARRLMGRRNYLALVAYDPEVVQGTFGTVEGAQKGAGRLSLAADFMVQGDWGAGMGGVPMKYGPVIIPSLEYGR